MAVTVYGRLVMGVVPRWALVTRAMPIAEINVDKTKSPYLNREN